MSVDLKQKRVAIIVHRVGPYHFARVRAAGRRLNITLIEMFQGDDIYKWNLVSGADGFERMTLFPAQPESVGKLIQGLCAALDRCRPDAVAIPGWADAVALGALQWCNAHGVPVIVMSESTEWDEPRKWWKEWLKRRLLKMCAAGFAGGRPHADYFHKLGVPLDRIFQGYDAVDNDYFTTKAAEVRSQELEVRSRLKLPEKFFLASARFVEKKNLSRLVEAYARYRQLAEKTESGKQKAESWDLIILGDGLLRPTLDAQLSTLDLTGHVHLPGFKQYDELPDYYGTASAFIHASTTEQWGLVVNEAMASGLPVLVSNRCGCASDLVCDGVNGFTFDPFNVEQLAELMLKLSTDNSQLLTLGTASRQIILQWGPDRFAEGLSQAVEKALAAQPPVPSALDKLILKFLLLK